MWLNYFFERFENSICSIGKVDNLIAEDTTSRSVKEDIWLQMWDRGYQNKIKMWSTQKIIFKPNSNWIPLLTWLMSEQIVVKKFKRNVIPAFQNFTWFWLDENKCLKSKRFLLYPPLDYWINLHSAMQKKCLRNEKENIILLSE